MRRTLLIIALAAVALVLGISTGRIWFAPDEPLQISGYVLDAPRVMEDFEMTDGEGESFQLKDFFGGWSFLYFGYTYCPDACPATMLVFAEMKRMLETDDDTTHFYLVSVDPARDTPDRMGEYVRYFDPSFRGITGPFTELDKLAKPAGIAYFVPAEQDEEAYLVDHSSSITVINPSGQIHAIFTTPHEPEQLVNDFQKIKNHYRP